MITSIKVDRKDIFWSYLAQFLSMGAGIITLPAILNKLTTEEIALNYILITIGSIIALVDLGFAPQFARNFTYVFSGATELKKEGIGKSQNDINYELLKYLLKTAKIIYGILSIIAVMLLLIIGTPYIYFTTDRFQAVPNALLVWTIYSIGIIFQVFYSYYFSMLLGAGMVKEQKIAIIANKVLYIIIIISGLFLGLGLISVALAQLISPFIGRFISFRYFYTKELKNNLDYICANDRSQILNLYKILWYNAKRNAIVSIGAYAILKFSMFIAGLYLTLGEFASYGLMVQLVGILGIVSCTLVQTLQPKFASLRVGDNQERLLSTFSMSLIIFYSIFIIGSIVLILGGDQILQVIKSNAELPSRVILLLYCIIMLLEYNHSNFAILISSDNKVPFAPASIITGIAVCIGLLIVVRFTNWGIIGFVLVQGICQAAYQNWKWPQMALNEFHITFFKLIRNGILQINQTAKAFIKL